MKRVYVLENCGEYLSHFDSTYCSWTMLIKCAMVFKDYQKAYNLMKKVNKKYGCTRCKVSSQTEKDWNGETWNFLVEKAE